MYPKPLICQSEAPRAELLQQLLPPLLSNLSLGRAQIAIDQIRSTLSKPGGDQIILVTARHTDNGSRAERSSDESPVAAVIAIQSAASKHSFKELPNSKESTADSAHRGDVATIVHAGITDANWVARNLDIESENELICSLSAALDDEFRRRSVSFVQWATDPTNDGSEKTVSSDRDEGHAHANANANDQDQDHNESVARWCRGFGLESIAELDYLSGPVDAEAREALFANAKNTGANNDLSISFVPISWRSDLANHDRDWMTMERIVERTYEGTQDCPRLNDFRSARQTMLGYCSTEAFDDRFWFLIRGSDGPDPIGCLILATHHSNPNNDEKPASPAVVEVVYMGLVPKARGRGMGPLLIAHAMDVATEIGGDRLILAVDQKNIPAGQLYRRAGLQPMLCEEVWCKSLKSAEVDIAHDAHTQSL